MTTIQGICCIEGCSNKTANKGYGKFRTVCQRHHLERSGNSEKLEKYKSGGKGRNKERYKKYKKDSCERCGFVPEHSCQLDVDHINGLHYDDRPENLQTLCANCHRLKTYKCNEYINDYNYKKI